MALTAFAAVDDLIARWPGFPDGQEEIAEILLLDASNLIRKKSGNSYDAPDELTASTLERIVCAMVRRSMNVPEELEGYTSTQTGVGPFNKTLSLANPYSDLFLTSGEKQDLGIGKGRVGSIRPAIHNLDGTPIEGW